MGVTHLGDQSKDRWRLLVSTDLMVQLNGKLKRVSTFIKQILIPKEELDMTSYKKQIISVIDSEVKKNFLITSLSLCVGMFSSIMNVKYFYQYGDFRNPYTV